MTKPIAASLLFVFCLCALARGDDAGTRKQIRLDDFSAGKGDWSFLCPDKKASGSLDVVKDPADGASCLKLSADFTHGGHYVLAARDLQSVDAEDLAEVHFKIKSDNATLVTLRLTDSTGQVFQRGRVPLSPDGKWQEFVLKPKEMAKGEHWGGDNDGVWHPKATQLAISITMKADPDKKSPVIIISDVWAAPAKPKSDAKP